MITVDKLKEFRKDFDSTIAELGKKHELGITLGKISYSSDSFTAKISAIEVSDGQSKEQVEFNKHCSKFGLKPDDYKAEVNFDGERIQIIGFELSRRKYPILVFNINRNKQMIYSREVLNSLK